MYAKDPVLRQFSNMKMVCSASAYAQLDGLVTGKVVWMHAPWVYTSSSRLRHVWNALYNVKPASEIWWRSVCPVCLVTSSTTPLAISSVRTSNPTRITSSRAVSPHVLMIRFKSRPPTNAKIPAPSSTRWMLTAKTASLNVPQVNLRIVTSMLVRLVILHAQHALVVTRIVVSPVTQIFFWMWPHVMLMSVRHILIICVHSIIGCVQSNALVGCY